MRETIRQMPAVALRGLVVFPGMAVHFDLGRENSIAAVQQAVQNDGLLFLTAQRDPDLEAPGMDDLSRIGTVAEVKQVLQLSDDAVRVLVQGLGRAELKSLETDGPYLVADIEDVPKMEDASADARQHTLMVDAFRRKAAELLEKVALAGSRIPEETLTAILNIDDAGMFADLAVAAAGTDLAEQITAINQIDELDRLRLVTNVLENELEKREIDREIFHNVRQQMDKNQKEFFLREQLKAIQSELGEDVAEVDENRQLREKITSTALSDEAREVANRELSRMVRMSSSAPEWNVIRTYLDTILGLPWGQLTEDDLDLPHARKILDEDHYGLDRVKERIIEFLAVRRLKTDTKGPILCLAGPPGVGKTSIARSIARALGKEFVRLSLGGVRDDAEIRGHRRTYIGAMPGRIVSSIGKAGTMNPVFLLDEIDKMTHDFRGDPASAMLEVLDPEINSTFRDHYLDVDFDLSKVLFITTANDIDSIPRPLYDRMEVIHIDSYTDVEKLNIAKRHLIAKQEEEHGLKKGTVKLSDAVLMEIIHKYTSESGVRELERQIAAVMRKAATEVVEKNVRSVSVSKRTLKDFLGAPKRSETGRLRKDMVGVVNGLAWTAVGGTTLCVEVSVIPGTGKLELTGQLGDVMKESAKTAISVVRGMSDKLRFPADQNERTDLHIHVPEGAVPKDGPSAGVTMLTAIASALTGRPVRHEIAMTGEITLTGRVLKIGGVKEKTLAALRAGIHKVIMPKDNKGDLDELPDSVKDDMEFVFVSSADEVLRHALAERPVAV